MANNKNPEKPEICRNLFKSENKHTVTRKNNLLFKVSIWLELKAKLLMVSKFWLITSSDAL